MCPNLPETTDLVTFTEKMLNGKLHILSNVRIYFTWLADAHLECCQTFMWRFLKK